MPEGASKLRNLDYKKAIHRWHILKNLAPILKLLIPHSNLSVFLSVFFLSFYTDTNYVRLLLPEGFL